MNTKEFIVRFLLLTAVFVAVAAETSVYDKKEGAKLVETPTVEGKPEAKDSLILGDDGVEAALEEEKDNKYEVDNRGGGQGGGWKGGGGQGGGWKGGGGQGGGWKGGGGQGGGWKGGGGRGGGGGGGVELDTEETNDGASYDGGGGGSQGGGWKGGGGQGGGWKGGGGQGGGWKGGGGRGGGGRGGGGGRAAELDTEETNDGSSYDVERGGGQGGGWKGGGGQGGGWKGGGGQGESWKGGGGQGGGWKGGGGGTELDTEKTNVFE